MDSITHLALGACMGEAFAGKKLGKKAMLWGAIAQSAPDIDFLASFWMDTTSNLLAHRGFTHSFLFCALLTPLLALAADRLERRHNISLRHWMIFFGGVIFAHIFFDAFNNYGVGWFEPFSQNRISFNVLYVADPLFSIGPLIAFIFLLIRRTDWKNRRRMALLALGMCGVYLCYALSNKALISRYVKANLTAQQINYTRLITTPAPFQNWLWYIVAGNDEGYHIGYRSVFDKQDNITFTYFPRNDSLLLAELDHESLHKLKRFSQEYYTIEKRENSLLFNDLRFGQVMGWADPHGKFVFHYYLQSPADNLLVVQRGRFTGWNKETIPTFIRRVRGN